MSAGEMYAPGHATQELIQNSKQPLALALADGLEQTMQWPLHGRSADELRKQHALLRLALDAIESGKSFDYLDNHVAHAIRQHLENKS